MLLDRAWRHQLSKVTARERQIRLTFILSPNLSLSLSPNLSLRVGLSLKSNLGVGLSLRQPVPGPVPVPVPEPEPESDSPPHLGGDTQPEETRDAPGE